MPLQGSLGHIRLADVLQTALAGSKGGELSVTCGMERAVLQLSSEGLHLVEPEPLDAEDLLQAFVERGLLAPEALKTARQGKVKGTALVEALIEQGALDDAQVTEVVASAVEDSVLELLGWREGSFRFEEGAAPAARSGLAARVGVDVEGVLIRAAQHADEQAAVLDALGSHPALFVALPVEPPAAPPEIPVAQVHAALDGTRTIEELALTLGLSRSQVLQATAVLVASEAARPASVEELRAALATRRQAGRLRSARNLALQWTALAPDDPDAVQGLVEVCEQADRPLEAAAALTMLGRRLLAAGRGEEALAAFESALGRRPGDLDAQEGLRQAASAQGDQGLWSATTLKLAQALLDADDPKRAGELAGEVLERQPDDVGARLMRLRAAVNGKDHDAVVEQAAALAERLAKSCTRRAEREAAQFARDAIALLAPERSDLLRTLRTFLEGRPQRARRVALVAALVGVLATAGVLAWPESPGGLLSEAEAALAAQDQATALERITQLLERFPDSEEAAAAFTLQARLVPPPSKKSREAAPKTREPSKERIAALRAALEALPEAEASAQLSDATQELAQGSSALPADVAKAVAEAAGRLALLARGQTDALALTRSNRERVKDDAPALEALLAAAQAAQAPELRARLRGAEAALKGLIEQCKLDASRRPLQELTGAIAGLEKAATTHAPDLLEVRRLLAGIDLEARHQACREQGPRLLVAGRLDELDRLYAELEQALEALGADRDLLPVLEGAQRRRLPDFVRERRAVVSDIQKGLEAARAAVEAGQLEAAAQAYRALAQRHYAVRFDDLVRLPLVVTSVPAGATVALNGKPLGTTPLRTEYPWGGPNTLSIQAPGFAAHVTVLDTHDAQPTTQVLARLKPEPRWAVSVSGSVEARPLDVEGDVLVCDRAGRLTLFSGRDGREVWTRHFKNLEGVRGRPAALDGEVWVAFLDGRLAQVDLRDGQVRHEQRLGRPTGDVAALDGVVALAVSTPAVLGFKRDQQVWQAPLTGHVTAGMLAAHDAFWLGTANGEVLRLDPTSGAATRVGSTDVRAGVAGLTAVADGLLVTTIDGRVLRLDRDGALRWTATNLGDLVGPAALAGGRVGVTDRRGRLLLLDAEDGSPAGTVEAGREAPAGVVARGDLIVALLDDGRVWAVDAARAVVAVDAPLSERGAQALGPVGESHVAVVTKDGRLVLLPVTAPAPAAPAPVAPAPAAETPSAASR